MAENEAGASRPLSRAQLIEREVERLCADDPAYRRATYRGALELNFRAWEHQRMADELRASWRLLGAYLARIDAAADPDSPFTFERLDWAGQACRRLLALGGIAPCLEAGAAGTARRLLTGSTLRDFCDSPAISHLKLTP